MKKQRVIINLLAPLPPEARGRLLRAEPGALVVVDETFTGPTGETFHTTGWIWESDPPEHPAAQPEEKP